MVIAENLLQLHKCITDALKMYSRLEPTLKYFAWGECEIKDLGCRKCYWHDISLYLDFSESPVPLLLYFTLTVWLIICDLYNIMHMSYKNERAMHDEISLFKENENGYMIGIKKCLY